MLLEWNRSQTLNSIRNFQPQSSKNYQSQGFFHLITKTISRSTTYDCLWIWMITKPIGFLTLKPDLFCCGTVGITQLSWWNSNSAGKTGDALWHCQPAAGLSCPLTEEPSLLTGKMSVSGMNAVIAKQKQRDVVRSQSFSRHTEQCS